MEQEASSQRGGASVTVVELRAKPPEGVVILAAACLFSIKQHGVWDLHALQGVRLAELHYEFLLTVKEQPGPGTHVQLSRRAAVLLREDGAGNVAV